MRNELQVLKKYVSGLLNDLRNPRNDNKYGSKCKYIASGKGGQNATRDANRKILSRGNGALMSEYGHAYTDFPPI